MVRRPDRLAVFDVESTGVDVETDRIVTAFLGLVDVEGNLLERHDWLIDPGIDIPTSASDVHGITTEMAQRDGRKDRADAHWEMTRKIDIYDRKGIPLVIYNAPYDMSILDRGMRRECAYTGFRPPRIVIDPLVLDKAIDPYRKGGRRLTDVAPHYGVPALPNAHEAEADCIMAGMLAFRLINSPKPPYRPLAEQELDEIHRRSIAAKKKQQEGLRDYWWKKAAELLRKAGLERDDAKREAMAAEARDLNTRIVRTEWPIIPFPETEGA